ncbi:MAG: right-handed parallel beta-helix repeat-containing protein [Planctomycetota bacterium]|nr:right-handed parallel beta-helix repeat-containing protein [Planctomycetota bacterium]
MSTRWLLASLILFTTQFALAAPTDADFYVAPNGNDQWSGKLADPKGNDGPFATVARAQKAARALRAADPIRKTPLAILIRAGTYFLPEPLAFTPEDSGSPDSPTLYAAYPNETPILSAGIVLPTFKKQPNGHWTLNLANTPNFDPKWSFVRIFVNGQPRYRPRLPKTGYYNIADKLEPTPKSVGKGSDRFKFANDDIRPDFANLGDVEALIFQVWTMARMRIESVDAPNKTVNFTGNSRSLESYSTFNKGHRYILENVKEALSQPGEFYLDRKTNLLTYIPMPGEDPQSTQVIAPKTETLLKLTGDIANRKWVTNVTFRGLTFAYTNWMTPPEGNNFPQAEVNLSGAILANAARNCTIDQCKLTGIATYAIDFAAACKNNLIQACQLTDMGAGGIKLGLTRNETNEELITSHNTVRDNVIAHGGRLHPAAIGIWLGHTPYNTIEHNDIFDFYYTAISVGWSWGYSPNCGSHHNTIAYNHLYNIGQGVLSDMGGIYTLGLADGTVLHHNLIHDVHAFDYGGWGIYFDEGTTHQAAENNVVFRTKTGGFHQHYGKENTLRNNIFAFTIKDQLQRTRQEPHLSFTFERNIVYWKPSATLLGSNWTDDKYKLDYNLYWRTDGQPFQFAKWNWQQWQERGQDKNSIIADPLFVDPENGDFRLKPNSPAEKIGFKPIDLIGVGARNNPASSNQQPPPPAFPLILPKP